jgi:hypothetical protein
METIDISGGFQRATFCDDRKSQEMVPSASHEGDHCDLEDGLASAFTLAALGFDG